MICPACQRELSHLDAGGGVYLDVCDGGCGGIWFDNLELKKFDEVHENARSPVFEVKPGEKPAPAPVAEGGAVARTPRVHHDDGCEVKRLCPRCCHIKMRKTFYSAARQVEVDQCGGCNGYWLDYGEHVQRRLLHRPALAYETDLSYSETTRDVTVPAGTFATRTATYKREDGKSCGFDLEVSYPHRIIGWSCEDGEVAKLTGTERIPYWNLNGEGQEQGLGGLGLGVPKLSP